MKLRISEILDKTSKLKTRREQIQFLRENNSDALRLVLQFGHHPNVKILLPNGPAPYTPSVLGHESDGILYSQARKLLYFCEGGHPNLSQLKREQIFIELLETIHPDDAKMLMLFKDKKQFNMRMTKELYEEAFPDIFN